MNIIYSAGVVIDVRLANEQLQARMTQAERLAVFGRMTPDPATLTALTALETQQLNSSVLNVCNAMVSAGAISQARASAISA